MRTMSERFRGPIGLDAVLFDPRAQTASKNGEGVPLGWLEDFIAEFRPV